MLLTEQARRNGAYHSSQRSLRRMGHRAANGCQIMRYCQHDRLQHDTSLPITANIILTGNGLYSLCGQKISRSAADVAALLHAQLFKFARQRIAPPAKQACRFLFMPLGVTQRRGQQRTLHLRLRFR